MPRMRLGLAATLSLLLLLLLLLLPAGTTLAGYYPRPAYHGTDHGAAVDCWDCHWFDAENAFNNSHVSPMVIGAGGKVYSVSFSGTQDFVKDDRSGICQVCHTKTKYWGASYDYQSPGLPGLHFAGNNCLSCHPHWQADDLFRPQMKGPQSHATHLTDPKGPRISDCTYCHYPTDYSRFADGRTIDSTGICDVCHSPDGPVDGVNDPVVGAKPNWLHGAYDGDKLKQGLEHWCDGCHDSGTSLVKSVQAPNVLGDNSTYGYNVTGHGRNPQGYVACLDCHASTYEHCDGNARTYERSLWPAQPSNYQSGYRLKAPLNIPKWNTYGATNYQLCLNCHDATQIFANGGTVQTNFRDDRNFKWSSHNLHYLHLVAPPALGIGPFWDSDWDGSYAEGGGDSTASCPACHNVHGSAAPAMTRHGELVNIPGGSHPDLGFHWYATYNLTAGTGTAATSVDQSRFGAAQLDYSKNHICVGCHGTGSESYFRVPFQVLVPTPGQPAPKPVVNGLVWTSDSAGNPKDSFRRGDTFKLHCTYYVCPFDPAPPYSVLRRGNISGAYSQGLAQTTVSGQTEGVYEVTWSKSVPTTATNGTATIKVFVQTTLLGTDYVDKGQCTIKVVP